MNYYSINTDARELNGCSPHEQWIAHRHAFASGDRGAQALKKLEPCDICFMYANKIGIVAVGRVCEHCDCCSYEGGGRVIYRACDENCIEYRISVDWYLKFISNPICKNEIREILGWECRNWHWIRTLNSIKVDRACELPCTRSRTQPLN